MDCPHGFSDSRMCAPCRGQAVATLPSMPERIIVARYDGECPECGDEIAAGETRIALVDGAWVCCWEEA